jgi:nucleoid-associated protein YgaU
VFLGWGAHESPEIPRGSRTAAALDGRSASARPPIPPDEPPGEEDGMEPKASGEDPRTDTWDATQWHEVQKGESLWKIAEHYYGDGTLYSRIFEANRDVLKNPDVVRVGQRLRIP